MWESLLQWAIKQALTSGRWELLVNEAVKFLAHTVKNPQSREAAALKAGVSILGSACNDFLREVQ